MTAIWASDSNGGWRLLTPSEFPAENSLHDLVEQAPHILPLAGSPGVIVLGRQVRLGNGSADLLAVESSGRLVVMEVKLAGNPDSRRAVVAQVLCYAAYLQGLTPRQLETQVLAPHLRSRGYETVQAAVEGNDEAHSLDHQAFADGLARGLAEGGFRLVVVLDSAPPELTHTIGYLESVTDKILVDLITVSAYDVNGAQVLVPQRVEPDRRARELSDAEAAAKQANTLQTGSSEFRKIIAEAPAKHQDFLHRLTAWAEQLDQEGLIELSTYKGRTGITTLLPRLRGDSGLVTIYKDTRSAYLQFWRGVFERRAPSSVQAVEAAIGAPLKQGNVVHEVSDELLSALTAAYREAAGEAMQ